MMMLGVGYVRGALCESHGGLLACTVLSREVRLVPH
jgi:hypothetical protein